MFKFVLFLLLLPALAIPQTTPVPSQPEMATQIREQFLHAWNSYRQYAWGHDELRPSPTSPSTGTAPPCS
jgi:hypothetical protein